MAEQTFRLKGRVIDKLTGAAIGGLKIEAWITELFPDNPLASAVLNENGEFTITFTVQEIITGRQPGIYFKVYSGERLLRSTENSDLQIPSSESEEFLIEIDTSVLNRLKIDGQIVTPEGALAGGVKVIISDKMPGREQILGQTTTDRKGRYSIEIDISAILQTGKIKPDLFVKIVDSADDSKIYGISSVRHNVESDQTFNLILTERPGTARSEFAELTDQLSTHLNGMPINELKEDRSNQDISFLSGKSGWDARIIAMRYQAEKLSADKNVPAELYYALFRAGVSTVEDQLFCRKRTEVKNIWKKAIEQNIIDRKYTGKLSRYLNAFENVRCDYILENLRGNGVSSFKELLNISVSGASKQKNIVKLYYNHSGEPKQFWNKINKQIGSRISKNLQLDSKLGYLTINNAPLISKFRSQKLVTSNPADLVKQGLYKTEKWEAVIDENIEIPVNIPGNSQEEKRTNYIQYMESLLKISYPSAVIAEMIKSKDLPLKDKQNKNRPVDNATLNSVYNFLGNTSNNFDIGSNPADEFAKNNGIELEPAVLKQINKLQRVYQISPSDTAMKGLWKNDFDSAYSVMQYDKQTFIDSYAKDVGGSVQAEVIYAKAEQVHSTVLNVATAYRTYKTNPLPYAVTGNVTATKGPATIAYPTLEQLFGDLDYCTCEHCKSVLGPAAYLVDILKFIDRKDAGNKNTNLLDDVLFSRRPDIQHIQLTCENTNTILPYIDLVNEILEHYVIKENMNGFTGFNIDENTTTEELLANPKFVKRKAYNILKSEPVYPFNLPYNDDLESLRLVYNDLGVPLYETMEKLRIDEDDDKLDLQSAASSSYWWRDILTEHLNISPGEYSILTDSKFCKLPEFFGEDKTTNINTFIAAFSNAKTFSRKTGITYTELVSILKTQFINPAGVILDKLENLHVDFSDIKILCDNYTNTTKNEFVKKLPKDLDSSVYGGNIPKWVKNNYSLISTLILLTKTQNESECDFGKLELKYITGDKMKEIDFWRLFRFIRLWKKLSYPITVTDKIITSFYPGKNKITSADSLAVSLTKLDNGFKELLISTAHLGKINAMLELSETDDVLKLLALWSDIDTYGKDSLYSKLFLHSSILNIDSVFMESSTGAFLNTTTEKMSKHLPVLQAAFNLAAKDLSAIREDAQLNKKNTILNLQNISTIFRYTFLSEALDLEIEDFIALKNMSGIDPFETDLQKGIPPILSFIRQVKKISESSFNTGLLKYLFQHEDPTGEYLPTMKSILMRADAIREGLLKIEKDNQVKDDPTGNITKSRMALVYENAVADEFFGILKGTAKYSFSYSQTASDLTYAIKSVSSSISYDHFNKQLNFLGIMSETTRANLISASGGNSKFNTATKQLYNISQNLFSKYDELKDIYDNFQKSGKSTEEKLKDAYSETMNMILPPLISKLKNQYIKQSLSSGPGIDPDIPGVLLDNTDIMCAENPKLLNKFAINDFLNLNSKGFSYGYYNANTFTDTDTPVKIMESEKLAFDKNDSTLPNPPVNSNTAGNPVSAYFQFYLEVPSDENYNFYIQTDKIASIKLIIDNSEIQLEDIQNDGKWSNKNPVLLKAGTLLHVELKAYKFKSKLVLEWESTGIAKDCIPPVYMIPYTAVQYFRSTYIRYLKAVKITEGLEINAEELEYICNHENYRIGSKGYPYSLPTESGPSETTVNKLFTVLYKLLKYMELKKAFGIKDEKLAEVLTDPTIKVEKKLKILKVTEWGESFENDVKPLLQHFGWQLKDLTGLIKFIRINDVYRILAKFGISIAELIEWTTNNPEQKRVNNLLAILKSKYDESQWFSRIQSISNKLRDYRRDAMVAYILHRMSKNSNTKNINTGNKLFEYLLIDVEMESCMKTSRIKQAISSVQLFIQRCLLNLEPNVSPKSIIADQWEWMKRYRIWEANRKVFLFPENWLDPEFRDDKSSFFKDMEGELLQSDITEESAYNAYLNYLEKLDDVAKLEIIGFCLQEYKKETKNDDVLHVIARTEGASRKYYYRRLEKNWTPWEKINLDIEDTPVLPVVWKDRLFLFWLNIIQKGPEKSGLPSGTSAYNLKTDDIDSDAKATYEISLSWSEYYNGTWKPRKTSDINDPYKLTDRSIKDFKRQELSISSFDDDSLYISVNYYRTYLVHFKLFTPNSNPLKATNYNSIPLIKNNTELHRDIYQSNGLTIAYRIDDMRIYSPKHNVLKKASDFKAVQMKTPGGDYRETPFFFMNNRHVFFVSPKVQKEYIFNNWQIGVFAPTASIVEQAIGTLIDIPDPTLPKVPEITKIIPWEVFTGSSTSDPVSSDNKRTEVIPQKVLSSMESVNVNNITIGPLGSEYFKPRFSNELTGSNFERTAKY